MGFSLYIDESGHSGDVVKTGHQYDFKDQPYFVLAAVGVEDETRLAQKIEKLRASHRIPPGELKAKSLLSKTAFVCELITWLCEESYPLFVELVDKKYFLSIFVVNTQILPPSSGIGQSPEADYFRNTLADFLYTYAPDELFDKFVLACCEPSDDKVRDSIQYQIDFAKKVVVPTESKVAEAIGKMSLESLDDLDQLSREDSLAYLRFLPSPDLNKRNKQVWMLPNLSSFTNIYARLNKYLNGRLTGVRLVHDVQLEYEKILRDGKATVEELKVLGAVPVIPHANYQFLEASNLEFAVSHDSLGIQIADIVAGSVMRFRRALKLGDDSQLEGLSQAMGALLWATDSATGRGLNQVVPAPEVLHITPDN